MTITTSTTVSIPTKQFSIHKSKVEGATSTTSSEPRRRGNELEGAAPFLFKFANKIFDMIGDVRHDQKMHKRVYEENRKLKIWTGKLRKAGSTT